MDADGWDMPEADQWLGLTVLVLFAGVGLGLWALLASE